MIRGGGDGRRRQAGKEPRSRTLDGSIPAREASRVAPAEAMRRASLEHETRVHSTRDLVLAALLSLVPAAERVVLVEAS